MFRPRFETSTTLTRMKAIRAMPGNQFFAYYLCRTDMHNERAWKIIKCAELDSNHSETLCIPQRSYIPTLVIFSIPILVSDNTVPSYRKFTPLRTLWDLFPRRQSHTLSLWEKFNSTSWQTISILHSQVTCKYHVPNASMLHSLRKLTL
jgi:hypothetical protein